MEEVTKETIRKIQENIRAREERESRLNGYDAMMLSYLNNLNRHRPNEFVRPVTHTTDPERRRILDGIMDMFRPYLVSYALAAGENPLQYLAPEALERLEHYEHNIHRRRPIHSNEDQEEGGEPEEYETIDLTGDDD